MQKRQTRLAGLDEKILDLYAGGMSVRDIERHLETLYGTTAIKRDTISRVTDAVLADVEAWRTQPLECVYPIVYLDALMVKVREDRSVRIRACYLAIGVTVDGEREVLGPWWQEAEGAKFWRPAQAPPVYPTTPTRFRSSGLRWPGARAGALAMASGLSCPGC